MTTHSFWIAAADKPPSFPELTNNIEVDVVIVGAGITGVTCAYQLLKEGKTVALIDAYGVGSGTTAYSTGNLYVSVQPYFQNIVAKFNEKIAKAVADSRQFAMDFIEKIIHEKNIKCTFARRPWFLYATEEKEIPFLDREIETMQMLDLNAEFVSELPLPLQFKKAATLPNQARFNPYQYVIMLAQHLAEEGCLIYENTRALEISEKKNGCTVKTKQGVIKAKKIIIATHTPVGINSVQMCTAPYRSYVVAVKLTDNSYPEGHFWDLSKPHHAICTHAFRGDKPDYLMVAGSHHKTGQAKNAEEHFKDLQHFLDKRFEIKDIAYQWSAQHYQSADDIPYIGLAHRSSKHTYMATGYFADGLVYGTLAGIILSEVIQGKHQFWEKVFNSQRFTPIASAAFVAKEGTNVFAQYMQDYPLLFSPELKKIKKGESKVVEIHQEKLAAYRDDKGQLHVVSAVCTHMKCIVRWNNAETTWDCPCHGSRFDIHGKVLEGPAINHLQSKIIKES